MRLFERLYRAGLALMPPAFRARHGADALGMAAAREREEAGLRRASLHVRAFTDHRSDSPLLRWADEAFVVNPRGKFRTEAGRDGWPVLDWA